ncbi:Uncharacterised protein [Salmonella enterica subsp. enterica serovar Typhi]|nr:Uncharacterised protein [Salmonella enterica subsp. enterica serovar Typhi]CXA71548.1 Uncharacterised protein [Salmonella enterica subsp. enterica serovar Typhi]
MHQRPALQAGKDGAVDFFRQPGVVGQNHAATRPAQRFMRGGGNHIGIRQRRGETAARHQPGKMRHIHQQHRADGIGNAAKAGKIIVSWVGRSPGDNQPRALTLRDRLNLIHINKTAMRIDAIVKGVKPFAGLIDRRAVSEMAAALQAHAQNFVAGFQQRQIYRLIRLAAGVRLHVNITRAEKLLRAGYRQHLNLINELTAAVVAVLVIAFGVFIG